MTDEINNLINRLQSINLRNEALEELNTVVGAVQPSHLRPLIPIVFECLSTTDSSPEREVCAAVLARLLEGVTASTLLSQFADQLTAWLGLPHPTVQSQALAVLSRLSLESPDQLAAQSPLVQALAGLCGSSSAEVGPKAAKVLTQLGTSSDGLQAIFSDPVLARLHSAMQSGDEARFRVYQLTTDLSCLSTQALEICAASGLMQRLNQEVAGSDVLVQLNAIELLSDLSRSSHGLQYLVQQGLVQRLEAMMRGLEDNPMAGLLMPGLIRFFGGLAGARPKEVMTSFPAFTSQVLRGVTEPTLQGVAMDTIAFIAGSPEGKAALDRLGNPMSECVCSVGGLALRGRAEVRGRALATLTALVALQLEHQTVELLAITESWLTTALPPPSLPKVLEVATQPFSDLSIPALRLMQSIGQCPWGQRLMEATPGFKEYLLDRSTETTKEGKEEKFQIVATLAGSPTAGDIFGAPFTVKLTEFANQGPHFVLAQSEVALERD